MKKKVSVFSVLTFLILLALLRNCTSKTKAINNDKNAAKPVVKNLINPPFPRFQTPRNYLEINLNKDTVIEFGTTKITIPACAFLTPNGSGVNGKVKISYREVNDPSSILTSGVPMRLFEESGEVLESAGMFELLAWQNNELLKYNPACCISMSMKSAKKDQNYNLYLLDTVATKWKVLQKEVPVAVPPKKKSNFNLKKWAEQKGVFKPVKPKLASKQLYQFNFKMDLSKYPELNIYNGVKWEFAGWKKSENPKHNPWVTSTYWYEMELLKGRKNGVYKLKLSAKNKEFITTVRPVFGDQDMEYAQFVYDDKYAKYRKFMTAKKAEIAKAKKLAEERQKRTETKQAFTREFQLQGLGWSNIDRILKEEQQMVNLQFKREGKEFEKITQAYLIIKGINSVISYGNQQLKTFKFSKEKPNELIVIDEQSNIYLFKNKSFKPIKNTQKSYTFHLSKNNQVASPEKLLALIENKGKELKR